MKKYKRLTTEQKEYIIKNYKERKVIDIAEELGLSQGAVSSYANRHGLRKTERDKFAAVTQKEIQSGDKSWSRITRGATVLEVYRKLVLLEVDSKCSGAPLRICMDKYDLAMNRAVVI